MRASDAGETLAATVNPMGADQSVIWESDEPTVAAVSQSGEVTPVGVGTAVITAKSASNETDN
ncbi:MAG: Ig-like domain-containing protein [Clostridiales bacterium]|nr:Ig-like domain-containing protein [Clostridiales bacterium]